MIFCDDESVENWKKMVSLSEVTALKCWVQAKNLGVCECWQDPPMWWACRNECFSLWLENELA